MTSCVVLCVESSAAPPLADDLEAAGIHVLGAVQRGNLVQETLRLAPDLLVCHDPSPNDAMFDALAMLAATEAKPVLLFTSDPDADKMARGVGCGIHAYVVNGYAAQRLRPLVHLAQARFAHEQRLRSELADVSNRFEERKLVDRAKGILMRARQVSEDEAFRVLRAASMHSNQRVGQISQQVIAAAGSAEAVNRAGQLRMLSQRLVKLQALQMLSPAAPADPLLAQSSARVDANLAALAKTLSRATYGDLVDAVQEPWARLKSALAAPLDATRLADADALAERVLLQADRLVHTLQTMGATSLHVINLAGRQRMLSQRLAKQALLAVLLPREQAAAAAADADATRRAFDEALAQLGAAPLSTSEIRELLADAERIWTRMTAALARLRSAAGQRALGDCSEELLGVFEQLTDRYERSMQVLIG